MGSEEELHCTPSGSCPTADVPVPGFLHAHATGLVLYNAGRHFYPKYANDQNKLNVVLHVLQVILDLFWTPQDPTSYVTALMIVSTCLMSVE